MAKTGLVSISFRPNSVEEIVNACVEAGLSYIEWGSDVHVPCGNIERAKYVKELCEQNGITPGAYGSYYRMGTGMEDTFQSYLETAKALGATVIRIWGGNKPSSQLTKDMREELVAEGKRLCELAKAYGITITLECHSGTITDEYHSTLDFLHAVDDPTMHMYWQPSQFHVTSYNEDAARALAPYVENIHVFHWELTGRYPLCEGKEVWTNYLSCFQGLIHKPNLLLEFMHDDKLETLKETAKTLNEWATRYDS